MKRNGCDRYRENLCLLASGGLADAECAEAEAHLAACPDCREYFEGIRSVTAPLANWESSFSQIEPTPALQQRWRNAIVSAGESRPVRRLTVKMVLGELWREWIRPFRYAWGGMAALWLVMGGVNFGLPRSPSNVVNSSSALTPSMQQAFQERRRLMVELVPPGTDPIALPARPETRPRSEWQRTFESAQIPPIRDARQNV